MSRQPNSDEDDVSLFPFLSVLACIIGTLALMIAALALGEMDNETIVTSEQYEQVQWHLREVRSQLEKLRRQTAANAGQTAELAAARASLDSIQRQLAALAEQTDDAETVEPLPDVDLAALEKELSLLTEQVKKLEQRIEQRGRPPEEAVVLIQPGGSGLDIDPRFVECRGDSIVIHGESEPLRIPSSQITTDATFLDLLRQIATSPRASVIFLIRQDGIGTYHAAHRVAQAHYAKNGKLPVLGRGNIDLSLFEPES